MKKYILSLAFTAIIFGLTAQEDSTKVKKLSYGFTGFVNLNAICDFNGLDNYDDFTTSQIPINPNPYENIFRFHLTARQSRLSFNVDYETPWGNLKGFVSGDFYTGNTGVESYFHLREAYLELGHLLLGQTNTTFGNPDVVPATVDFEGPNSSTTLRNPMIRYSNEIGKNWSYILAIEMRGSDIRPFTKNLKSFIAIPTLVGNINKKGDWGIVTLSGMFDITRYFDADSIEKKDFGYGGAFSAIINTWKQDHVNLFFIAGKGVSNFIDDLSGGGYNGVPDLNTNKLVMLNSMGGFISYTHYWNNKFSSNLIFSYIELEKTPLLTTTDFRYSYYALANLFYSPFKRLNFGVEYNYGKLYVQDNQNGDANRLQFLAQFNF
ncbi:MAG: porin [Bacteroidetes bacterium]|nr:porin [Bacteroidota bacterium]